MQAPEGFPPLTRITIPEALWAHKLPTIEQKKPIYNQQLNSLCAEWKVMFLTIEKILVKIQIEENILKHLQLLWVISSYDF